MEYKVFGCKVNKYYTDRWLGSEYLSDKKGVFIASCVVTDNAKRKWIRFVKKQLQTIKDDEKIFISGCGAFKNGKAQNDFFELYSDFKGYEDKIEVLDEAPAEEDEIIMQAREEIKNQKKIKEQNDNKLPKISISKLAKLENLQRSQISTKKFVLIQGGCDSFCTFCLTVQKRGRHYYRSAEDIAQEIQAFADSGGKEVVLTGVNLGAWGLSDTNQIGNSRFAELLEYLLENTTIPRLRISSLGPEFVDDKCLKLFSKTRIYPHFHYSVQSGSSSVLKSMRRHYDGKYMRELLEKTKNIQREDGVDISIGADLIVGFPGESEEDFKQTLSLVTDGLITKLHAFPFSPHHLGESVPAGFFKDQIDDTTKKERMHALLMAGDLTRDAFIESQIGKNLEVLIEKVEFKNGKQYFSGWSQNYIECDQDTFEVIEGNIARNEIVKGILRG